MKTLLIVSVLAASIGAIAQTDWFSLVALPDTQNEAEFAPDMMLQQTQFIAAHRSDMRIKAVLGLGDIVNDGASATQQQNADRAIRVLDEVNLPYFMAIGNHDYDGANVGAAKRIATGFNKWWGPARYTNKSFYRGHYPAGSNENFYGVLSISGKQFLIMVLEYVPRTASLDWAMSVIKNNPDKNVIVVTHASCTTTGRASTAAIPTTLLVTMTGTKYGRSCGIIRT